MADGNSAAGHLVRAIRPILEVIPANTEPTKFVVLVAAMALAAGPTAAGETTIDANVTAAETYTDNVDLDPGGQKTDALLSDLTPSLQVRSTGRRVTGALNAATTLRYQTGGDDKGFNILPNVIGFGNAELIEEWFFVDASTSATRVLLDTGDSDTESNQETVFTYSVSPYVARRFGSFAGAELRADFSQVLIHGGSASDETTYGGQFALESGADFSRFLWAVNSLASNSDRSDDDDTKRRQADLSAEYVAFRYLSVLGRAGYQFFDDGDPDNKVDAPIWNAGLRIRPTQRLELVGTYGKSDDRNSFAGNLRYEIRPQLKLSASYAENLGTAQEQFRGEPAAIGLDEQTSEIINPDTGQRFTPKTSVSSIDNQTALTKTARAALVGTSGRNTFELGGTYERRDTRDSDEVDDDTDIVQVGASWRRQLTPRLNFMLSANYRNENFKDEDRKDDNYEAGATLRYSVFKNLNAFTSYSYRRNDSTEKVEEYVENRVTIGLQYTF